MTVSAPDVPEGRLTPRQIECLHWIREGKTSLEIAIILDLSARTVDAYVGAACLRLGVQKRHDAVRAAERLGLLPPSRPPTA